MVEGSEGSVGFTRGTPFVLARDCFVAAALLLGLGLTTPTVLRGFGNNIFSGIGFIGCTGGEGGTGRTWVEPEALRNTSLFLYSGYEYTGYYGIIYTYTYTYTHIHIYTHTCVHTYMYTYIHVYIHTCLHFAYILTYVHTFIRTHTHTRNIYINNTHTCIIYIYIYIYIYI